MQKFLNLRDKFYTELEKISIELEKNCWNFYINSTPENMQKYEDTQELYSNLFKDKDLYANFLEINKENLPKHEQKQLKNLLKEFDEELNSGEDLKNLRKKENEIAKKINSYVYKIDNKEISKTDLIKIIQTEKNQELREKAYKTKISAGDLIAEDLVEFVKQRNIFAKNKGYSNYFEYKLKEDYEVDLEFLNNLINEVYTSLQNVIKSKQQEKQTDLKEFFDVDTLKSYHYGFLLDKNCEKEVNKILENNNIEEISKKMYQNMGYNIEEMVKNGNLTLDLYPRKGKNTHGFCFGVEAGKDSRILANLTNNVTSLDTLNHEMGHCIYDLGISTDLCFGDKRPASSAFTEAIAMMMGDIIKRENVLKSVLSDDLLEKFKNTLLDDEINFVTRSLLIIEFEKEFYENPNKNPAIIWKELKLKYLNRDEELDNEWATIPHYLSHPAYYQNYFRANLMKVQIYNHLKKVLNIVTENKSTKDYLIRNIFSKGAVLEEYDLIKELTSKDFSAKDFIEQFKK